LCGVAQCRVRNQHLPRCERTRIIVATRRTCTKKSDLKTQRITRRIFQPAGDVPPFGTKLRMAAFVARKHQRTPRHYRRVRRLRESGSPGRKRTNSPAAQKRLQESSTRQGKISFSRNEALKTRSCSAYQSSRTAFTTVSLIAARALQTAVASAETTITAASVASCSHGMCKSMLQ